MTAVREAKRRAAVLALEQVKDGMRVGLGTGSTAAEFVDLLGERVVSGLTIVGVPTSERTAEQARRLGIPLATLDDVPTLDLTVDGADEFDDQMRLIKGGGGALLREKIVAIASRRMIVIADSSKASNLIGRFPLPVEVNRFGLTATRLAVVAAAARVGCHGTVVLRTAAGGGEYVTDGGHLILDCAFARIDKPEELGHRLHAIPGVVEHGLFLGIADAVISADAAGELTILGHLEA